MVVQHESKPGYLTTEFWVTILTLILNNVSVLPIPDKWQGAINAILPVGYALARGLAKLGHPEVSVLPSDPAGIEPDVGDVGPAGATVATQPSGANVGPVSAGQPFPGGQG